MLTWNMSVVDVYKIKPFTRNDIPPTNKYHFKICLKLLIKTPERRQLRSFECLIWKFLMLILIMYLSAGHYIYYLFAGEFLYFEKISISYRTVPSTIWPIFSEFRISCCLILSFKVSFILSSTKKHSKILIHLFCQLGQL